MCENKPLSEVVGTKYLQMLYTFNCILIKAKSKQLGRQLQNMLDIGKKCKFSLANKVLFDKAVFMTEKTYKIQLQK